MEGTKKVGNTTCKKIKPVLRYAGSKFKKLDTIFKILNAQEADIFLDLFAGSGIVGVNAKHLFPIGNVILNDYDNILQPITEAEAVDNMLRFDGHGTYSSSAQDYFIRRIDNGYWDKFDKYNSILDYCKIYHFDIHEAGMNSLITSLIISAKSGSKVKIYIDPPYYDIKGLYKSSFNHADHEKLFKLVNFLIEKSHGKIDILISYNDCPNIRWMYMGWKIITEEFQYSTGSAENRKKANELWITNS